jgi:hypothetical protein
VLVAGVRIAALGGARSGVAAPASSPELQRRDCRPPVRVMAVTDGS